MSNYILNNTAEEIDIAIGRVANATTTPLDANSNMVTSGGVKAYVDTQVGVLNNSVDDRIIELQTEFDTLNVVSISTAGVSSATNTNNVAFTTANFVTGVEDAAHNLERASTYIMKTPTGGASMLSVNISWEDGDTGGSDDYYLTLYIDNIVVARQSSNTAFMDVYKTLCYNSYVLPDKEIKAIFTSTGGSIFQRVINVGSITCVNYQ